MNVPSNFIKLETTQISFKWINKLWYIQTIEFYSVIKRTERLKCTKIRMNHKSIILSGKIQMEKAR